MYLSGVIYVRYVSMYIQVGNTTDIKLADF